MSQAAPYTTPDRVVVPCYCWIRKPGTETRCTLEPGHRGEHYHGYSFTAWPNRGPEPQ
ncbi:hypothetical protein [Streptomyces sp. NBC_01794]|uniref:hypothetical protein n=1 Tax=Streptomyces sp. NBC_01794 TaxID=2975942 RepID=UPI003087736A|nr:hypothetical protein OIE54_11850 [Streptomyces sp. NBC_01794]